MSWIDYRERIESDDAVVLIPVGAIEQHGPHLPLSTDTVIPQFICEEVAAATSGVVAASLTYGSKSVPRCGGGQHFCGTTSLDGTTIIAQIRDIVRDLTRHGVGRIAFINGHMENSWFITEGIDVALREVKMLGLPAPRVMHAGYWEFLSKPTMDRVFEGNFPDWALEHAGIMETSVMLHLVPDEVHMDRLTDQQPARIPIYDVWPYDPAMVPASGILNTARGATAEKGRLLCDEYVGQLAAAVEEALPRRKRA